MADLTDDLSLLLIGLVGLVWLYAGMIVFMAISHYLSQMTKPETETTSTDHRDAA